MIKRKGKWVMIRLKSKAEAVVRKGKNKNDIYSKEDDSMFFCILFNKNKEKWFHFLIKINRLA